MEPVLVVRWRSLGGQARSRRRLSVVGVAPKTHLHGGGGARRAWRRLQRLTAESGLWSNAGGRFGDLIDAKEWMASSSRMRKRRSVAVDSTAAAKLMRLQTVTTTRPTMMDQISTRADAAVTWTLAPIFKCCEEWDKMQEIRLGTVFSNAVVHFMLATFGLLSEGSGRLSNRLAAMTR